MIWMSKKISSKIVKKRFFDFYVKNTQTSEKTLLYVIILSLNMINQMTALEALSVLGVFICYVTSEKFSGFSWILHRRTLIQTI